MNTQIAQTMLMKLRALVGRLVAYWWRLLAPLPRKFRVPVSILSGALLFYTLMVVTKPQTKPYEPQEESWPITVHEVMFGEVVPEFPSYGEVVPAREIDLRALVSGEVIAVADGLQEGAFVKKGEELLTIDPFEYENALGEAEAQLVSAEASLKMSRQDFERGKKLFEKGTVARRYLDERQTDFTVKKANADRLRIVVRRARRNLENARVVAPFDAYVSNVNAREGRLINTNDHVARLSDASRYEIRFNLSDSEYGDLIAAKSEIIGQPVKAFWKIGHKILPFTGKVKHVGAIIDQSTRGVDVIADVIDSGEAPIRGGAFVEVLMQGNKFEHAAKVPASALFGGDHVYVVVNNRLQKRPVTPIMRAGSMILLAEGVENGEKVLTTRFEEIADGVLVSVP